MISWLICRMLIIFFLLTVIICIVMNQSLKGDFKKVPWHFKEQTTDNKDIYLKENNREVIIDYQEQTITFNQNWNEVLQKYEMILTVSSFD